jgi:hypothetical protein
MRRYFKILIVAIFILAGCNLARSAGHFDFEKWKKGQREYELSRDLCKNTISWICDANEAAGGKCAELVDSLLKLPELSIKGYFCAAVVFNILNQQQKAIETLETAITRYPDERAPIGVVMPAKVVGRFWIAELARQIGDIERAKETYETILKEVEKIEYEGKENGLNLCRLHLSEIELENLKRQDLALERLKSVKMNQEHIATPNKLYDIYKDWAEFQQLKITKGKSESARMLKEGYSGITPAVPGFAASLMQTSIMSTRPLSDYTGDLRINEVIDVLNNRIIEKSKSSIDRDIVRLGYGFDQEYKKNYSRAEKLYSALLQEYL